MLRTVDGRIPILLNDLIIARTEQCRLQDALATPDKETDHCRRDYVVAVELNFTPLSLYIQSDVYNTFSAVQ